MLGDSAPREKILLVEDEKSLASFFAALFSRQYELVHVRTGEMAVHMAASHAPDLILLGLGLPDMDGLQVLGRIREWSDVPVIIVSARQEEQEKVKALDSGANDYVTKPFGSDELLARIRAAIRTHKRAAGAQGGSVFQSGGLTIDYERRIVAVDGVPVHLTRIEYKLIVLLSKSAGRVLTHEHLLECLWGPYASENQTLRVNVANIRRKIEKNPASPAYIVTEVGVGYRMAEGRAGNR